MTEPPIPSRLTLAEEYEQLYDACVQSSLGADFLRLLWKQFIETPDFVEAHWHSPEAHDLLGHVRRANFEQDWRSLGDRTPGVVAAVEHTGKGRSNYTVLTLGRLVLTSSCVDTPFALPRFAEFRRRNAEERQFDMYQSTAEVLEAVYAILTYGGTGKKLGFAQIAFPDASCQGWLHRIDLRKKYPDVWGDLNSDAPRPVEPKAPITLLPQREKA
jgi:hypothetical protein